MPTRFYENRANRRFNFQLALGHRRYAPLSTLNAAWFTDLQPRFHDDSLPKTAFTIVKCAVGQLPCDADQDNDVDISDITAIFGARNTAASGSADPRDFDGDGFITVNDARKCVLQCTNPSCQP